MSLTLTIIKSPKGIAQEAELKVFAAEGGSIGRGQDNTWVLQDPERFLSSRHCEIRYENGQYYVLDQSTNGTFLNGAAEPIGKGGRAPLSSGDVFEVGEYQFSVNLDGAAPVADDPFGDSPFASAPAPVDDDFTAGSPFAEGVHFGDSLPLSPDPEKQDPLAAFDEAGGGDPFAQPSSSGGASSFPIDDPFQQGDPGAAVNPGGSFGDNADPLSQNVDWPSAHEQNLIPDDWDDDFLQPKSTQLAPEAALPPEAPIPDDPLTEFPQQGPVAPAPRPRPRPGPGEARPQHVKKGREELKKPAKPEPAARPSPRSGGAGKRQQLVIDSLIEAMGMDSEQFNDEQKREIGRIAGELMREVTAGMMQLLRSRTSLKNEFRMNVTTIQPVENNPLKFSANVDEALENMFVRQSAAYKKPVDSFREGYQGIAEHQIAIIAGVRSAFKGIMESFDPERLARRFDRGKKGAGLPMMQKAKYWTAYTEYYEDLAGNMEHTFQHLFGDDFVQAYEDQLSKLAAQRKK